MHVGSPTDSSAAATEAAAGAASVEAPAWRTRSRFDLSGPARPSLLKALTKLGGRAAVSFGAAHASSMTSR